MIIEFIAIVFQNFFSASYKLLDQYLVSNFLAFVRGFEFALFMTAAVIFLLITVAITLRRLRKLPKSYIIEVTDLVGSKTPIDGLRQVFSTYEAAESYARMYRRIYGRQYSFRVKGTGKTSHSDPVWNKYDLRKSEA